MELILFGLAAVTVIYLVAVVHQNKEDRRVLNKIGMDKEEIEQLIKQVQKAKLKPKTKERYRDVGE